MPVILANNRVSILADMQTSVRSLCPTTPVAGYARESSLLCLARKIVILLTPRLKLKNLMLIPWQDLSDDALEGVARSYVITQISVVDTELKVAQWTAAVIEKVRSGELVVEFSEVNQSVYLKPAHGLGS